MRYDYPVVCVSKPDLVFNRPCLDIMPLERYRVGLYGDYLIIRPDKHGSKLFYDGRRSAMLHAGIALRLSGQRGKTHHKLYRYKDGFAIRLSEELEEG